MRIAMPSLCAALLVGCGGSSDGVSSAGALPGSSTRPALAATPSSATPAKAMASGTTTAPAASSPAASQATAAYDVRAIALPGGGPDGVAMDYLLFDAARGVVWVPAGNTGSVDAVDTESGALTRIEGFPTRDLEREGRKRVVGPSSVTIGDGVVYVGNRGDATICAVNPDKHERTTCGPKLDSMPDGITFVDKTREVWVTTPHDHSVRVLDAQTLKQKAKITLPGQPEGYAVDLPRGRFYTNFEDTDETVAIDLATHETRATWKAGCGKEGPRGLRLAERDLLFVACTDQVVVLDLAHDGAVLSRLETGEGVDDLDYLPRTRTLYVGAARTGDLSVAHVDEAGHLTLVTKVPTKPGARNPAVDAKGRVFLAHSKGSELIEVSPVVR